MQSRSSILSLTILTATIGSALPLHAAEWTLAPRVQVQTAHDSNIRMTNGTQDSVLNYNATAGVTAKRRTETLDASLTAGYTFAKYSNAADSIRDRDQQFAQGVVRKKWARWAMGLSGGLRRDDLLRVIREDNIDAGAELDFGAGAAPLPDDPPEDGLVPDSENEELATTEQVRRSLWRGTVYGQYELTERDRLRVGYAYARSDFSSGDLVSNIRDSERNSVDFLYARDLSERTVITTSVSIAELETSGRANSDFYQGLISWRTRYNETSKFELGAGVSKVKSSEGSSTGFRVRVRGSTILGNGRFNGELSRALLPNAFGNVAEADTIKIKYSRPLSQQVNLSLDIRGQRRERGADDDRSERNQLRTGLTTNWSFTREWTIGARYDFSWLRRKGQLLTNNGSAYGHRGTISVTWTPQKISIGQ